VLGCAAATSNIHIQEFNTAVGTPAVRCILYLWTVQTRVLRRSATEFLQHNTNTVNGEGGGARGGAVDTLRYKPEGCGFDSR